ARHDAAAHGCRAHRFGQRRGTDVLDHDVDPAIGRVAHRLAEIGRIEGGLGAQLERSFSLGLGAAGHEHARAQVPGDRRRSDRHATACADDQHLLARAQPGPRREHPPCGEEGERKGRRFFPRKSSRLAIHVACVDMKDLAGGPVRVLADDPEVGAHDVLPRPAPLAYPVAQDRVDHYLVTKAMRVFVVLLTLGCLLLSALPAQAHSALPPGHKQIKYSRWAYPSQVTYGPIEDGNGETGIGPAPGAFLTLPFMGPHYITSVFSHCYPDYGNYT